MLEFIHEISTHVNTFEPNRISHLLIGPLHWGGGGGGGGRGGQVRFTPQTVCDPTQCGFIIAHMLLLVQIMVILESIMSVRLR